MTGSIDGFARALIALQVRSPTKGNPATIEAWIDTAFNGELVVPRRLVEAAGFPQSAGIEARLADGSVVTLESYSCVLDWFGEERPVEVIANDGEFPLLGIGLLKDRRLVVDYRERTVTVE